jgi:hypothetical protein
MGKTIEAGLVLKELKLRGLVERVLILAPKSLMLQWIAEMQGLFGERFDLVLPGDSSGDADLALREQNKNSSQTTTSPKALPTGKARVKLLYEEYIHLHWLKEVWDTPLTESPVLEPSFAAGMHGIELCFLLLAEFIADSRHYVAKRPRIEKVSADIASQCTLLVEIINGELEEEGTQTNRLTLTQEFPFPGAPPSRSQPSHSPGLARLESAIRAALPSMSQAERNSLIKVVINFLFLRIY